MISVEEKSPQLIAEWDESNEIPPEKLSYGSNKKVIWHGTCDHRWEASPKARSNGVGCPYCSGKRVLIGFNDLHSLYPELAAEWSKSNPCAADEITVGSSKKVEWVCRKCGYTWNATVKNRVNGSGCPNCAGRIITAGINDFATLHPEAMLDWSAKNDTEGIRPDALAEYSNKKVWWECHICGHEWKCVVSDRSCGSKCPCCSGQVIKAGSNDLLTVRPDLAMEWSVTNGDLSPRDFSSRSRKMVYWTCKKCGKDWKASIYSRCHGKDRGCTFCSAADSRERAALKLRKKRKARQEELHHNEMAVRDYVAIHGMRTKFDTDELIGVPVEFYFPDHRAALILPKPYHYNYHGRKMQRAINDLLRKKRIRVIRILEPAMEDYDDCICIRCDGDGMDDFDRALEAAMREITRA